MSDIDVPSRDRRAGGPGPGRWPRGSLLASFCDEARREILSMGTLQEFAAGEQLLHQGDSGTHVLILLEGLVKVTADTAGGTSTLLSIRVAGDAVGELASLDAMPRLATVTAAGLVRARRIGRREFNDFLVRHPAAARAVSGSVSAKLRWATARRVDFGAYPVDVRLARLLLDLAARHGEETSAGLGVGVALSQPELATLIGASEPSVHRALRDLRRTGALSTGYRRHVVTDVARLREFAEADGEAPDTADDEA